MDDYSKEILYKCFVELIDGLNVNFVDNKVRNNVFAKILEELPNTEDKKFDYSFIYIYIIAIILNNRSFFNSRFEKLSWKLQLRDFYSESTINGYAANDYGLMDGATDEDKALYEKAEADYVPYFYDDYQDYLAQKYKDSPYNPDDLEIISFEQKYSDSHEEEDNNGKYSGSSYEEFIDEHYQQLLSSLPERLKNMNGPNINMIIQCIRNALAHNQFNFTKEGLSMYSKDSETGIVNFECCISHFDMVHILEEYINIILDKKNIVETPYINYFVFNRLDEISRSFEYSMLKNELEKEFKSLGLEIEFSNILDNIEKDIEINREEYLEDYDPTEDTSSEEEYLNVDRLLLLMKYVKKYFKDNYNGINEECKLLEILLVLKDFDMLLEENWFDVYKAMEYKTLEILDFDGPESLIDKKFPSLEKIDMSSENKAIIAKIIVLLNIVFVQCSYENVDKTMIDLSTIKINEEYLEEKSKIFEPQIEKIKSRCDKSLDNINRLSDAIGKGLVSTEKKKALDLMKDDLLRMKKNISKLKDEWESAIKFDSLSIINHIRNSFAHGAFVIQPPEYEMDLKSFNIIIRDYEPETDKLTFSGTISIYDLLTQLLKPEIMHQLFDFEHEKNKSN